MTDLLEIAIKEEIEAKAFYRQASEEGGTSLGRALFARLAKEEDFHAAKAREISEFLQRGESPLAIEESLDRGLKLGRVLAAANDAEVPDSGVTSGELEIVNKALEIEENSKHFYEEKFQTANTEFERRYFKALKQEEICHYAALKQYLDWLTHRTL